MSRYIAILGFAQSCSKANQAIALEAGELLAGEGFSITGGNVIGTPQYAFQGAKRSGGSTMAIIEQNLNNSAQYPYCDLLQVVSDQHKKHKMLAEHCLGAIVIGGGPGTLSVIQQFLAQNKPVIAIENSGGIANNELRNRALRQQVIFQPDLNTALAQEIQFWPNNLD